MRNTDPSAIAEALLPQVSRPITLTPRGAGRSGARVYTVTAGQEAYILKLGPGSASQQRWAMTVAVHEAAAAFGVSPKLVASDPLARAVVSTLVPDRSFFAALFDAARIEQALGSLVDQIATLHTIEPSSFDEAVSPLQRCEQVIEELPFELPASARDAWETTRARGVAGAPRTLCHLDLNPSNVLFDGSKVWLVDWDTAGLADRWLDLATVVNMFLLPAERERWILERYIARTGVAMPSPERFVDARRLAYVGYGFAFLGLVRTPPTTLPLGDASLAPCYRALREGRLSLETDPGRLQFAHACFAGLRELG